MAAVVDIDLTGRCDVLIVEDQRLVGQFLERALALAGHRAELVTGPTAEAIIDRCRQRRPDVVILDLDLGAIGRSVRLIPSLVETGARVMMLTGNLDPAALGECLATGASDVVTKDQPFDEVLEHLRQVFEGGDALGVCRRQALVEEWRTQEAIEARRTAPFDALSRSEQAVLAALIDGCSLEAIAAARFVSLATVRSQVRAILTKLGVNSQLAAVAAARRAGWHVPTAV
jgi:DNA-binding NarL/FixJ family response regulator